MGGTALRAKWAVVGLSALLSTGYSVQVSHAAFSGSASNASSVATGTVTLSDSRNGSALFNLTSLSPGDSGSQCLDVTYTGSVDPDEVRLYLASHSDSDSGAGGTGDSLRLSDDLTLSIEMYAAGQTCATASPTKATILTPSPLLDIARSHTNYGNGMPGWDATAHGSGDTARSFEFDWSLPTSTANDAQGDSTSMTFVWETQS